MKLFQLLGDMLLDRSNSAVMTQHVSSRENLSILMNLLRILSLEDMLQHICIGPISNASFVRVSISVKWKFGDEIKAMVHRINSEFFTILVFFYTNEIWHVVDSFLKLIILVFFTDDSLSSRVLDCMEGS